MAYRPTQQQHYHAAEYHDNTGVVPDYPPGSYPGTRNDYDAQSNWDAKSYQSSYAGSQAHLYPQYEMAQVSVHDVPPVPAMPYQNYPPSPQHPYSNNSIGSPGYSTAREKLMKRRSVKHVELFRGNLVLDVPVPSHIIPASKHDVEEMSKMRYTAATCDPDEFKAMRYSLRPYLMGRHTELFIVMTMYNEDDILFLRTMNSVIKNISHLCARNRSKTWGPEGWKKVVVCVVSDGRSKINKRTLQVLALMGCYQEGIAKDSVAGRDVTAHIFEYTSHVVVTESGEVSQGTCPVQIIFCLKEQNKKKLNSHRWFFNAFGPLINPNGAITYVSGPATF
jgi:chitin synthase